MLLIIANDIEGDVTVIKFFGWPKFYDFVLDEYEKWRIFMLMQWHLQKK